MLRIETRSDSPDAVTYALEGRVTREYLSELRELLAAARAAGRQVTLDLAGVVLVEREVVEYFAAGEGAGVAIVHCPAWVRSWIRCEQGTERGSGS